MIRAIANRRLDLSDEEFKYYTQIVEELGVDDFRELFITDKNGIIISISPPTNRAIPMLVLFFVLNLMLNQRIRIMGAETLSIRNSLGPDKIADIERRLQTLEDLVNNGEKDAENV
jgi:hypothetical protein